MITSSSPSRMTVEEYLAWEPRQELRYEYVNGDIVAMTGGSIAHNDIAINLLSALRPHLRQQGCRINLADVKVNVAATLYQYPDLIVTCDPQDQQATDAFSHPKLIVEVLSPNTEAKDRGEKLREYRALPSLEEYVLISSTQISVEIYRRAEGKFWLYSSYAEEDSIKLESIDFEFPVRLLYENITAFEQNPE